jgi:methionine-rich copper-binding protein CopC
MLRGGAGDDVFLVNASSDLYQNGASEIIDGGDGNDTLRLNAVGSFDAYSFPFSSIETFELNAADTTGSWAFSIRSLTGNANNTLTMKVGTGITLTQQMNINAELVTDATQKLVVNPGLTSGTMTISGTSGNDSLQGGAGNDTIKAGPGTDYVDGGAGDDVFVYQTSHGSIAGETYIGGTGSDTLKLLVSFTTTNGYTTYEDMPEGNYIDLTTVAALTSLENIDTRTSVGVERVKMRYDQRWASDSGVTYVNGPYFKAGSNDYLYLTALPSNQHVIVESSDTASTNPTQVLVFDQGAQGIILERFYSNTIHNDQLDLRKVLRDGGFIANEAGGLFQTAITSSSHAVDNGVYYMDGAAAAETPATLAGSFTDKLAAGDQALLVHAYSAANPLADINTPQSERLLYGFQVMLVENTGTITATEVLRSSGVWSNVTSGTWTDNFGLGSDGIDAGNFVTGTYLGTAAIAPELWSSTPADNATSVAPHNNLVLTFSENVKSGSGNIVITTAGDANDTRTIAVTDTTQVTISNNLLTINPTNDLLGLSDYSVTMASGVISDNYDHAFAGISATTTLNFTTSVEVTAPTLVSSTPADGSAGLVGANASIVLTFSENVKVGTGDIVLTSTTNVANNKTIAVDDAQVVFNNSNNTVTITPTGGLAQWNHYNVTMAAGVIKDMVGNDYAGISNATTLNFTTTGSNPYASMLGLMASSNGAASGLVFGFWDINGSGTAGDTVITVDDQYTWTEFAAAIAAFNSDPNNSGPDLRMATRAELEALRADPSINTNQISLPNGPAGWAPPTQADDSPDYWVSTQYQTQTDVHYYVSTPGYGYNAVADSNIAYAAVVLVGLGV